MSRTRSRSSWSCASWAQSRWATCGGLNVPPSTPTRGLRADVPRSPHDVLERAQLAQPDRAARVELLRRVADLGAEAELAAVGEPRRGVDVDAGRVDAELEGPRAVVGARDDRLGVPRPVAADAFDRPQLAITHPNDLLAGPGI